MSITTVHNHVSDTVLTFLYQFMYILSNNFNYLYVFCFMLKEAKARGDADTFEVSHDRLELGRQIGKGAFGRVFVARAEAIVGIPGYSTVAVKKLKSECFQFMNHTAM